MAESAPPTVRLAYPTAGAKWLDLCTLACPQPR
jgi:hypothetical protein